MTSYTSITLTCCYIRGRYLLKYIELNISVLGQNFSMLRHVKSSLWMFHVLLTKLSFSIFRWKRMNRVILLHCIVVIEKINNIRKNCDGKGLQDISALFTHSNTVFFSSCCFYYFPTVRGFWLRTDPVFPSSSGFKLFASIHGSKLKILDI